MNRVGPLTHSHTAVPFPGRTVAGLDYLLTQGVGSINDCCIDGGE